VIQSYNNLIKLTFLCLRNDEFQITNGLDAMMAKINIRLR